MTFSLIYFGLFMGFVGLVAERGYHESNTCPEPLEKIVVNGEVRCINPKPNWMPISEPAARLDEQTCSELDPCEFDTW